MKSRKTSEKKKEGDSREIGKNVWSKSCRRLLKLSWFCRECMWQLWRNLKTPKHQKCSQSKPYTETSRKQPPPVSDRDHLFRLTVWEFSTVLNLQQATTWHMVLLNTEVHRGKNGQKWFYSLAVVIAYTTITVFFLVRSITTILTITLEKKTQISRFQF